MGGGIGLEGTRTGLPSRAELGRVEFTGAFPIGP